MTCICVLTAFRPSFPHLETLKKNIGKLNSLTVRKKKKKKIPTDRPNFQILVGWGQHNNFFFGLRRSCKHLVIQIYQKGNDHLAWDETISAATPLYTVWQWRFYPIVKTCKKWVMTLSSLMAMYSVMRDIPDARNVPIERGWVALYLYATGKFSN